MSEWIQDVTWRAERWGTCQRWGDTEKQQWLIKTFAMNIAGNIKSLYDFFSRPSSLSGPKKERKLHIHHFYRHNCVNAGQVFHGNWLFLERSSDSLVSCCQVLPLPDKVGPDTGSGQCLGSKPSYWAPLMGHILSEGGAMGGVLLPWEVGGWRSEVATAFSGFKACWRLRLRGHSGWFSSGSGRRVFVEHGNGFRN